HRAQQIFPDKVFRAQLERQAPWADRIRSYFARHPDRTFQSPLPLPLALGEGDESSGTPEDAAELAALTAYKRVHALTRNHTVVGTLLDSGLTSASDLSAIGVVERDSRSRNAFEDDIIALEETHSRALATTAALTVASSFLPVGPRPSLCECAQC